MLFTALITYFELWKLDRLKESFIHLVVAVDHLSVTFKNGLVNAGLVKAHFGFTFDYFR